jgi:uroporphyrinogen decarboxylase
MMGGFDKRILAGPKAGIRRELARLAPVIEEGGYLPGCDHGVPHDVPLENYAYLVDLLKGLYGIA